jgi:Transposase DDE domain
MGFDGGKKVGGRKRHLLVDTEGLEVKAIVHSAKVLDQDGIKCLLEPARSRLGCLIHLGVDAGYPTGTRIGFKLREDHWIDKRPGGVARWFERH